MTLRGCFLLVLLAVHVVGNWMSSHASSTTAPPLSEVVYGANCDNMTQCNYTNAVCNGSGICACADTHYYYTVSDTCTQKVEYGANCDKIIYCNTTNVICNGSGICVCADSHYYDTCTQEVLYGAICATTTQCNTTNAICNASGICACADTHFYNPTSDTCTQKMVYEANCATMTQCNTTNAVCNGSGICACADTHYYNTDSDTCIQKQGFGDVCIETSQCNTTSDSNIVCIQTQTDKKCLCTDGWYRPGPSPTSCTQISGLKTVITVPPTIGIGNINISWTHADVTGGYTSIYTVRWSSVSPASSGSATTTQKNYNIQRLSLGTTYTVSVTHIIRQYGRSQTVSSVHGTFTTKQVFAGVCTDLVQCDTSDTNIECVDTVTPEKRCLCKTGMYKPSTSASCTGTSGLKPVITVSPTIGTGNIDISWTHAGVTGGYTFIYTVTWSPVSPASSGSGTTTQKNYNIQPLSPGTTYTVTVTHTITLYGRTQRITPVQGTFTTKQVFGGDCSNQLLCDTTDPNVQCIQSKCLCIDGMYRPAASCTTSSPLKPVITGTTGIGSIALTWTNDDAVTGGYTSIYTVTWSPGSPGTATTTQKSYTIQPLSQGATYNVTVIHTITLYGRSQAITSDPRTFTTRIDYNGACTQKVLCYDASANCYSGRCRCDPGYYRDTTCVSIAQLRPMTVTAVVQNTTTMTATWTAPPNDVVTGYEVSVTPGNIAPINVGSHTRTTPITGLTQGREYTVSVKTKITYLQGRDEMTVAVSAAPTRTTPASVTGLDMTRTNRTAPDITVVFPRAAGDADSYVVTLSGRDGDTYNQQHQPANPGTGPISVVFTGVVAAVSYNLTILTQSGTLQSSPYTTVIRVQSTPAGIVTGLKSLDITSRSVSVEWRKPLKPNGHIYEYRVDVRTGGPSVCVKRVIINCTECNRQMSNFTQMETKCTTTTTVVITQADIDNTAHVIQYNITGLKPDTAYTIDVVAVNEEGPGTPDSINIITPMEGAGDPTNFKAQSKSSSEITLTWDPPQPRPGVTQYNITVYEKQENGDDYDTVKMVTIPGWEIKTNTIGRLYSYWPYKFDIVAETKPGASAIASSSPVMTMESEPTGVLEFKVETITDVFNQVQVSWKCPKQKGGRNGEIRKANLYYFTNQQSTYVESIRKNVNFTNSGDCMWNEKVDVTTEFEYLFEVRLYNKGFAGSVVSVSKVIVGGPPSQTAVMNSVREGTGESETPPLLICPRCLYDRTNGQVNKTGLIVCQKDNCGQTGNRGQATAAVDYDNMANWNAANAQGFVIPYRATKDDWLEGFVGRPSLLFTLGIEDCSGNTKNLFCNGKPPTGDTFIVYAFSCTNYGCTTSNIIEISTTAPVPVPVAAVVGGVVAAVVAILVGAGIFIFLRRRKSNQERPKMNRNQNLAKDQVRPEQDDVYEKISDGQMVTVDSSRSSGGYVNSVSVQSSWDTDNTYEGLVTYQNADGHDYGRINIETRFK